MNQIYAFNGDADGLCALQQLRLAAASRKNAAVRETLVTGVKRDIALLDWCAALIGDVLAPIPAGR